MGAPPLLKLENLSVVRGGRAILDGVSLRVEAGEHTAILGPNGAGKSTLLQLIRREIHPHGGRGFVRYGGEANLSQGEVRRRVAFVAPFPMLADFSAREVALSGALGTFGHTWRREVSPEMMARADALLDDLGVASLGDRPFSTLSTGEARRVLIARALVGEPQVLVLDEPTAGLDPGAHGFWTAGPVWRSGSRFCW